MSQQFPTPVKQVIDQDNFSNLEVGVIHPSQPSYLRIHNNGDVELTACDGLSMVMHAPTRTITFVADQVKFITKDDGFRWNTLSFNKDAYQFQQPTFFQVMDNTVSGLYRGADVFLQTKDERNATAAAAITPLQ